MDVKSGAKAPCVFVLVNEKTSSLLSAVRDNRIQVQTFPSDLADQCVECVTKTTIRPRILIAPHDCVGAVMRLVDGLHEKSERDPFRIFLVVDDTAEWPQIPSYDWLQVRRVGIGQMSNSVSKVLDSIESFIGGSQVEPEPLGHEFVLTS